MMIIVPNDHALADRSEVVINDLNQESLILTEEECTYRAFLQERLKAENVDHNIAMELSSVETIKKAVGNKWVEKSDGSIKAIRLTDKNADFYSQLVYRKEKPELNVFKTFIDLCNEAAD
jgi:DNA-binding transcriptional LysR family regulator